MRRFGTLCIALGAVLILCAGAWLYRNESDEQRADAAAQQAMARLVQTMEERTSGADEAAQGASHADGVLEMEPEDMETGTVIAAVRIFPADAAEPVTRMMQGGQADTDTSMPVIIVDGVAYIGFLTIPEIGLELPVQAECTEELLKNAPCWYSGSLKGGDLVIAGHNYKRHFTPVKQLEPGAKVIFRDALGNETQFSVLRTETLGSTDIEGMTTADGWDMTLFTCNYGGQKRIAVRLTAEEG